MSKKSSNHLKESTSPTRFLHLTQLYKALSEINQAIVRMRDEAELFPLVCRLAVDLSGARMAWIGMRDPETEHLVAVQAYGIGTEYTEHIVTSTSVSPPEGRRPSAVAFREGRPVVINYFTQDPMTAPWHEQGRRFGWGSSGAFPIQRSSQPYAQLSLYYSTEDFFDTEIIALFKEMTRDISFALDNFDREQHRQTVFETLQTSQRHFRAYFERSMVGMAALRPDHTWLEVNESFCRMLGYTQEEMSACSWADLHHPDDLAESEVAFNRLVTGEDEEYILEKRLIRKDGSLVYVRIAPRAVRNDDGSLAYTVSMIEDITERKQAEARIRQLAFYDSLTGLPNRHTLEQYLPKAAARARRHHSRYAVGFIDLDNFKPINDRWGHQAGDKLLKQLAGRLREILCETDFVARLGGDEFVVVFENLNARNCLGELRVLLERLHRVVETPFDLGDEHQTSIDMTMGLVIAGEEDAIDTLLRQTDVAMCQAKQHKAERTCWWCLAGAAELQEAPQAGIDPFGPIAQALLSNHGSFINRLIEGFMKAFYDHFQAVPKATEIFARLNEKDFTRWKRDQAEHLRFITSPQITREALYERSRQRGQILALMGVDSALMVSNFELYQRQLAESLDRSILRTRDRYRLLKIVIARHDIDLQCQIRSIATVHDAYYTVLTEPSPEATHNWHDLLQPELARLGNLPGIMAVILMRPDALGRFIVEATAGVSGKVAAEVINLPDYQIMTDPHHPRGQGMVVRAWRDLAIHDVADYLVGASLAPWRKVAKRNGVRSALAIPIRDSRGHAAAVLELFGAYPHQFSSSDFRCWGESLQHRYEVLWGQRGSSVQVVSADQAALWRERLFTGGLRLYLQPVVDLENGRMIKAEGLARVLCEDGTLILPGQFLPLLGANELYQLFWLTLDQAIDDLSDWRKRGLDWSISINLAPSSLLEPDLATHIEEQLKANDCPAELLTLEVLESENIAQPQQETALRALKATGVGLALDDLGAGYASLLRVVRDPLDVLKIDQNLIRQLPEDPLSTLVLLWTLINLAQNIKCELIVEGLETPALIEVVQQLGGSLGQGHGIARPMPADELPGWAEAFTLPVCSNRITTFAGALSRHWAWQHTHATALTKYVDCPSTAFFEGHGLGGAEVAQWHRCIHAGGEKEKICSDLLLDWLVMKVREEGVGMA